MARSFGEAFGESFKSTVTENRTTQKELQNIKKRLGFISELEQQTANEFFEQNPNGQRRLTGTTEYGTPKYQYLTAADLVKEKQEILANERKGMLEEAKIEESIANTKKTLFEAGMQEFIQKLLSGKSKGTEDEFMPETIKSSGEVTFKSTAIPPADMIKAANDLRQEFRSSKTFLKYQEINSAAQNLQSAFDLSVGADVKSKIASDQALGVLFQKLLDPTSVVRESEYARTPEGAGIINRMKSYLPKLEKGGLALADEDRAALVQMGKTLLENSQKEVDKEIEGYTKIADKQGLDKDIVFGNIKSFGTKKYSVGQEIDTPKGKVRVIDFYPDGEPDVELVQ